MTLTRWKLLAGVFGLSICGFAALAEPACRGVSGQTNRQDPLVPEAKPKGATEVKPKPASAPEVPVVDVAIPATPPPAPAVIPTLPSTPVGVTTPADVPTVLPVADKSASAPGAAPTPIPQYTGPLLTPEQFDKQLVKQTVPDPIPPTPLPSPVVPPAPGFLDPVQARGKGQTQAPPVPSPVVVTTPLPSFDPLPLPGTNQTQVPVPAPPIPVFPMPELPSKSNPFPTPPAPEPMIPPVQNPLLPLTPPVPPIAQVVATATDKKLKVTLQMDENNPKFEVRDGDEVVLKVVSEKVDVTSPKTKGELWSTLKATGRVKFMTPGGDGFCDELQVVPGTGEVIAVGHVKFTYNWGKVETSASAEKMNFRLGAQQPLGK